MTSRRSFFGLSLGWILAALGPAQPQPSRSEILLHGTPEEVMAEFREMARGYVDRIKPVATFCREYTDEFEARS